MMILKLIAGPVIGAVIGYFTNYIAVKMLFKPHYPKFIGKKQVPFTPGLIPKRKNELAGAIGRAVSENLLTSDDLAQALPADSIKESIADKVWEQYEKLTVKEDSVQDTAVKYISREKYDEIRAKLENALTEKAVDAVNDMHVGELIVREGVRVISEKVQNSMLAMFLNEQTIRSFAEPLGDQIESYLAEHGESLIRPVIAGQIEKVEDATMASMTSELPLEKENILKLVDTIYERCFAGSIGTIMENIDIAGIIEAKIQAMDVQMLEELVLSVMKKELDAIVNLGALIGLVIGMLNLLINML